MENEKIVELNTLVFQFIVIDFYETLADPSIMMEDLFDKSISERMSFEDYKKEFIPFVQDWADYVAEEIPGISSIKVLEIGSPKEYNFFTDYAIVDVDLEDDYVRRFKEYSSDIAGDGACTEWWEEVSRECSGYFPFERRKLTEFMDDFNETSDTRSIGMFLSLLYIHLVGDNPYDRWIKIMDDVYEKRNEIFI